MTDAPRKTRLSKSAEFDRVYRQGRSAQHRLLILYRFERPEDIASHDPSSPSRIGITVSKKVGGAVERNKLKRQLRELLRANESLDAACDYVAIARPGLAERVAADGFDALDQIVAELITKLHPATKRS